MVDFLSIYHKNKKIFFVIFFIIILLIIVFLIFLNKKEIKQEKVIIKKNESNNLTEFEKKEISKVENKTKEIINNSKNKEININYNIYVDPREPIKKEGDYKYVIKTYISGNKLINICNNYKLSVFDEQYRKVRLINCSFVKLTNFTGKLKLFIEGDINKKIYVYFDKKNKSLLDLQPIGIRIR